MTEKDKPRGHVFDGIEEHDNDLPSWWVALFLITIVFSVGYMVWYHFGIFPSQSLAEHYDEDLETTRAIAATVQPSAPPPEAAGAPAGKEQIAAAREVFTTSCAPCHGANAQGVVGPNLTDDFWLNGATQADVERVITKGSLEKGMPAWGEILGAAKIRQLVGFIVSVQGSNPAGAKPAQGSPGKLQ